MLFTKDEMLNGAEIDQKYTVRCIEGEKYNGELLALTCKGIELKNSLGRL